MGDHRKFPVHIVLHHSSWYMYGFSRISHTNCTSCSLFSFHTSAPITPCRHAAGELTGDMARVYDLVTRHFIASVSQDAVWKSTTVCLSIDELQDKGNFTIRGKQVRE